MPNDLWETPANVAVVHISHLVFGPEVLGHARLIGAFVVLWIAERNGKSGQVIASTAPDQGGDERGVQAAAQISAYGYVRAQSDPDGIQQQRGKLLQGRLQFDTSGWSPRTGARILKFHLPVAPDRYLTVSGNQIVAGRNFQDTPENRMGRQGRPKGKNLAQNPRVNLRPHLRLGKE